MQAGKDNGFDEAGLLEGFAVRHFPFESNVRSFFAVALRSSIPMPGATPPDAA